MKTQFTLLFLLLLFLPILLFSQEKDKKDNFDWGVKAGFNYGTIAAKDISTGDKSGLEATDLYASIFAEFKLNPNYSIQTELGYSAIDELLYWELPVLAKYRFEERFQIGLGPKISYISNKYFYAGVDLITRWGFSLQGTAQYNITKHWLLETSYTYGLNKQVNDYTLGFKDGKWRAFRLGFGYKF
jgi:hypothetical protein